MTFAKALSDKSTSNHNEPITLRNDVLLKRLRLAALDA